MASLAALQPRPSAHLRNEVASQVAAHVCTTLPVGYWQRRLSARAFGLEPFPAMPRDSQHVRVSRLPGVPPIRLLSTEVLTWGLLPWTWPGRDRTSLGEARRAIGRLLAASPTLDCVAVIVASPDTDLRAALPRLRLAGVGAPEVAVGVVTWPDLADLCEEAVRDLGDRRATAVAAQGARLLRQFVEDDDR